MQFAYDCQPKLEEQNVSTSSVPLPVVWVASVSNKQR